MTTSDLSRKVRQLDNDVQSVYEMLARIEATQNRQGNRLGELAIAMTDIDGKLNRIIDLLEKR